MKLAEFFYFIDYGEIYMRRTLHVIRKGITEEFFKFTDERFDFLHSPGTQIGDSIVTYSWGAEVKVTKYTNPMNPNQMKSFQLHSL